MLSFVSTGFARRHLQKYAPQIWKQFGHEDEISVWSAPASNETAHLAADQKAAAWMSSDKAVLLARSDARFKWLMRFAKASQVLAFCSAILLGIEFWIHRAEL